MKIYFRLLILCLGSLLVTQSYAQTSRSNSDTTARYFSQLANSANDADKVLLETQLYQLLKSDKEKDWSTARRFFYQLKKVKVVDSIVKEEKIKFPLGQLVRNEEVTKIYDEKDAVKQEKLYWAWVKKFPPQKFGTDEQIIYDYARSSVSHAYAEADNVKKALQFANMVVTPAWKGEGWAGTAIALEKKGHYNEAKQLYQKAIANSYAFMTTKKDEPGAGFAAMGYYGYKTYIAQLLVKQKKYNEALKYIQEVHDSVKTVRGNVNSLYAQILVALGKNQEAFDLIDEAVKNGKATPEIKETLKTLYVKVKGSNEGYDEYMASINKILIANVRAELAKQIINQPAANFTLKDVDGNTVSLAELKGKIVVLDFWATWCGPCKRSFPAMKMAVNRYKDNPDVKFLFIHTWERQEHAADSAKAYITRNNYPFQVLMDLKNADGINEVLDSYKVSGIPTKFVIDKNGNIRFRFTGFSGDDDAAVEEVSAMIEMARNSK